MVKISNNALVILLVFTIVVSITGTYSNLGKVQHITGAAAAEAGTVNVSITRTASITCNSCNLSFADTAVGVSRYSGEAGDVQNCDTDHECGINISNDGSVPVNITLFTTDDLFTGTTGATSFTCNLSVTGTEYWGGETPDDSGGDYSVGNSSIQDCRGSVSGGDGIEDFIWNLSHAGDAHSEDDWFIVDFSITVPSDESGGDKEASILFTASDAEE